MPDDDFSERLGRIRTRFAAALPQKIDNALTALPTMTSATPDAIETIVSIHRTLHEMCGIAPSVGLPAIGTAARAAETVLREPAKSKRPLNADELSALKSSFDRLRETAQTDLQQHSV